MKRDSKLTIAMQSAVLGVIGLGLGIGGTALYAKGQEKYSLKSPSGVPSLRTSRLASRG